MAFHISNMFNTANLYSFIMAVGVHGLIVLVLLFNWGSSDVRMLPDFDNRNYIDVDLMPSNPHKVEKQQQSQKQVQKKKQNPIPAKKTPVPVVKAEKRPTSETPEKSAADGKAQAQKLREEERMTMEQSLARAVMEEEEYQQAVTDDEKAMAYVSRIQRDIVQNWSRPPSARNGMQALLRVFLVPTGELVQVMVEESSGNDAFDRSAVVAVKKAEPFEVPDDPGQFERNFRQFTVLFRPEDLRL